jgi:23S rRNA (cytidine1920-2'-O)/16S rRNA (cytidine1409-2'-O)-methyltransferase
VVRDSRDQALAIATVLQSALNLGWYYQGLTWSPLVGPAGNLEYLLWLTAGQASLPAPALEDLQALTMAARTHLSPPQAQTQG